MRNRFSVLFAPFSFALKEKGDRSRDARKKALPLWERFQTFTFRV